MDERSLRALLVKAEREWSGRRAGGARGFWTAAALVATGVSVYLGWLLARAGPLAVIPRLVAAAFAIPFVGLALYSWVQVLRSGPSSRR